MKKPNKLKILITKSCYLVFLFSLLFPNIVYAKNKYEFISWKMPVQRFSEFGVSPETMADLVGDGQFVVNLKPQGFVSWDVKNNEEQSYYLIKEFSFNNFIESQKFVNKIGVIAEEEGHHPDISFGWGYCKVKIFTHAIKGLAESDFILAAKIDNA